jgi:predicted ATP-grasp superfamily ATP-dependent carboligase
MRILIHEFVTGGGWLSVERDAPSGSLLAEGQAMLSAVASDFAALRNVHVDALRDARLPALSIPGVHVHQIDSATAELRVLGELAAAADAALLIAPEFDGHLLSRVKLVEDARGRLLSPGSALVEIAADKHATAEHLTAREVPAPRGVAIAAGERLPDDFIYPAVLKPRHGAGSLGVRRIESADAVPVTEPSRLEAFCPGVAASVACLCGPGGIFALEPCLQHLAGDGQQPYAYRGGSLPLDACLAERARTLAVRAVRTLPEPHGYLGVDLVLGPDPAGGEDFVVEINPRLTTSYVGLRGFSRVNLAGQMVAVAEGRDAELCWTDGSVQFLSSGACRHLGPGELVS